MSCWTTFGSHSWIPEEFKSKEAILASLGTWSEDIPVTLGMPQLVQYIVVRKDLIGSKLFILKTHLIF